MEAWSIHHLSQAAEPTLGKASAQQLKGYAQKLIRKNLPVIFTLRHLAKIVGVDYQLLRATAERRRESANYRMFAIKKRSGGRRFIHQVSSQLFITQKFINSEILQRLTPSSASYAFHSSGGIRNCASAHCGARWLFQYDLKDFFYSISEKNVYAVFVRAGYRPLLAFELARICTTTHLPQSLHSLLKESDNLWIDGQNWVKYEIYSRYAKLIGVLPQGAPTSPMLSNLAAFVLDEKLTDFADAYGLTYTRYADDITLSVSNDLPERMSVGDIHRTIVGIIRKSGFRENEKKTRVAGPGSKKLVLGLLVDGEIPRISKETYKRIDRHLYAALKFGLVEVAKYEKFDSPMGFYNHLCGLVAFVKDVDPHRWTEFNDRLSKIPSPWALI